MKTQTKFLTRTLLGFVTTLLVTGCLHAEISQSNSVSIISVTPASPVKLRTNEMIMVKVRYSTTNANPVLICVDAYAKGTRADCFSSGGASPAYTQKIGEAMNYFSVVHVPIDVDEVRVEMIEFKTTNVLAAAKAKWK